MKPNTSTMGKNPHFINIYQDMMLALPGRDYPPTWWAGYRSKLPAKLYRIANRLTSGSYFPPSGSLEPHRRFRDMEPADLEDLFARCFWSQAVGLSHTETIGGNLPAFLKALSRPGWLLRMELQVKDPTRIPLPRKEVNGIYPRGSWMALAANRWLETDGVQHDHPSLRFCGTSRLFFRSWQRGRPPVDGHGKMIWYGHQGLWVVDRAPEAWIEEAEFGEWIHQRWDGVEVAAEMLGIGERGFPKSISLGPYILQGNSPRQYRPWDPCRYPPTWRVDLDARHMQDLVADIRHWPYRRWLRMSPWQFAEKLTPRIQFFRRQYAFQTPAAWVRITSAVDRKVIQWLRHKYRGQARMSRKQAISVRQRFSKEAGLSEVFGGVTGSPDKWNRQNKKSRISGDA